MRVDFTMYSYILRVWLHSISLGIYSYNSLPGSDINSLVGSTISLEGDVVVLTATAIEEGYSKLTVVAELPENRQLQSDEHDVIVYPPLASDWPEVSLLPGAEFQLRITGGPPNGECQYDYQFSARNIVQEVAEAGTAGPVLRGLHLGNCTVRVQCVNLEEPPLLTLPIHVLDLSAVRIHAPRTSFWSALVCRSRCTCSIRSASLPRTLRSCAPSGAPPIGKSGESSLQCTQLESSTSPRTCIRCCSMREAGHYEHPRCRAERSLQTHEPDSRGGRHHWGTTRVPT